VSKPAEPSSNAPFRGNKGDILEGGIRVPWITYWPGKLKPGVHHDPICVIDLLPTFLRLASQPLPEGLDGVDIWPSLRGEQPPARDYLYWRFNFRGTPQGAVRKGDWKYYTGVPRSQRAKLKPAEYLYNLREDPGETRNLAAEQPKLMAELRTAFQDWSSRLQDPAWPSD